MIEYYVKNDLYKIAEWVDRLMRVDTYYGGVDFEIYLQYSLKGRKWTNGWRYNIFLLKYMIKTVFGEAVDYVRLFYCEHKGHQLYLAGGDAENGPSELQCNRCHREFPL